MTTTLSDPAPRRYLIDPDDPRAPTTEMWQSMTPAQRARVVAELPTDFTLDFLPPPEGDRHVEPRFAARDTLRRHFRRVGGRVFVASDMAVYYPGERVFAPDVFAVVDVDPHNRESWVVDAEGKGLDMAVEIIVSGDPRKDMKRNVVRYASLGISDYFVFDRRSENLHGFRLPSRDARVYERIPTHRGRLESRAIGMDLAIEDGKIRFFVGDAPIPDADDLIERLGSAVDQATSRAFDLEQQIEREQRLREEEQRLREEEQRLREEAERRLAEALAELEALKRNR